VITLRPVTADDEALLLRWANDPVTRAAGFRPARISSAEHHRWLAGRLTSAAGRLYIALRDGDPVGQLRLDRLAGGRVEVGIAVAPEVRGRGIGRALLQAGLDTAGEDRDLAARTFVARVRPDNGASIALFEGAGFRLAAITKVDGQPCLVFEAEAGASGEGGDLGG
jgi:RimJ/RimL family protein N-acetyltransferase